MTHRRDASGDLKHGEQKGDVPVVEGKERDIPFEGMERSRLRCGEAADRPRVTGEEDRPDIRLTTVPVGGNDEHRVGFDIGERDLDRVEVLARFKDP